MDGLPLRTCCHVNGDPVLRVPDLTFGPGSWPLQRDVAGCPLKFNWANQISENAPSWAQGTWRRGTFLAWGGWRSGEGGVSPLVDLLNRGQTAAVAVSPVVSWQQFLLLSPATPGLAGGPLVRWPKWGGVFTSDPMHHPTPTYPHSPLRSLRLRSLAGPYLQDWPLPAPPLRVW